MQKQMLASLGLLATVGLAEAGQAEISLDSAVQIAQSRGMVTVRKAELDHGVWEVKGQNSAGVFLELKISASDGKVVGADFGHPSPMRHGVGPVRRGNEAN
jgi:uncharacterized membrane protein YkoI